MKVKLEKNKLTDDAINIYNKPKYVYVPLISGNDSDITILVKKGEYVSKGSIIGKRKGNFRIPLHSSVSGTVIDFEEHTAFNNQKVKCVVIENDFKEKISDKPKKQSRYSKSEFVELLRENGIVGMGGSGFPTYVKYDTDKKIKTLIINAVECEPYITADYALITSKCEEILEAIDTIMEINDIDEAIIAVKKNNLKLKELFNNFIGTYLKIKICLVPNNYPMGWERTLVKEVKNVEYKNLPIEQGIIVNNISTIYAIYETLKFGKPLIERIVTFTGEGLQRPQNVLVKVGTSVKEIVESLGIKKECTLVAGGPMMGINIVSDDLVISPNMNCVLLLPKYEEAEEIPCLRCGKCVEVCPAKLSPVMIMDNHRDKEKLTPLRPLDCVECGLCSYICPSKILVREFVKKAKGRVK